MKRFISKMLVGCLITSMVIGNGAGVTFAQNVEDEIVEEYVYEIEDEELQESIEVDDNEKVQEEIDADDVLVGNSDDLSEVIEGTVSLKDIKFNAYDILTGKFFSFDGNSGRPAIIIWGGITSCSNTMDINDSINSLLDRIEASQIDVYLIDVKNDSEIEIRTKAGQLGYDTRFNVGIYTSSNSNMYAALSRCRQAAGASGSSFSLPCIAYVGADGIIKKATTGYVEREAIKSGFEAIGFTIESSSPSDEYTNISVKYGQTEGRKMFQMIKDFRNSGAWYWNSDNSTKTYATGLNEVHYSYHLEAIAMLRAAEIAKSYSHTRPNGKKFSSAYEVGNLPYRSAGENIAMGYTTAEAAFEAFREDDKPFGGQGHRRNMLYSDYAMVGIGHCVYNGTHFWVQEFMFPYDIMKIFDTQVSPLIPKNVLDGNANVKIYTKGYGTLSITSADSGTVTPSLAPTKTVTKAPTKTPTKATSKVKKYYIEYVANGATSGSMGKQECKINSTAKLKANSFVKTGYKFNGWNTKKNGKGKSYKNKASIKNLTKSGKTVKLYAQWKANKYTIKFNKNGGKGSMKNTTVSYGQKKSLPKNSFKKKGYKFAGWATSKIDAKNGIVKYKNKAKIKNLTAKNNGKVTMYAVWEKKK